MGADRGGGSSLGNEDHLKIVFWLQIASNGSIFTKVLLVTERPLPICINNFQILVQFSKIWPTRQYTKDVFSHLVPLLECKID